MDKTEILKEKIADAELVLIGIGEEFNENFGKIGNYPHLMKGLEEIDSDESIAWAVPFLEKAYLEKEKEGETVQAYKKLYELVKNDDVAKNIPVVIFSSLVNDDMRKKGEELGADAQLSKPEIGNLVKVIDKLLAK